MGAEVQCQAHKCQGRIFDTHPANIVHIVLQQTDIATSTTPIQKPTDSSLPRSEQSRWRSEPARDVRSPSNNSLQITREARRTIRLTSFYTVYVKGKHLSYQRGKRNTNPNTSLVKIEGVDDPKAAQYEHYRTHLR